MTLFYLIPQNYTAYYNQAGILIANNYDELLEWFTVQEHIVDAHTVLDVPDNLTCSYYKILMVTGRLMPSSFIYAGGQLPNNRIIGKDLGNFNQNLNNLCNGVVDSLLCATPVIGTPYADTAICQDPVLGTPYATPINQIYPISDGGNYTVDPNSNASKQGNIVTLSLTTTYASQSGSLLDEVIGILDIAVTPLNDTVISNTDQQVIPSGSYLHLDIYGNIRWTGVTNVGSTTIQFSNLIYNIS